MLRGAFYRAPLLGLCLSLIGGLLLGARVWFAGAFFLGLAALGAFHGLKRKGWGYPLLAALLVLFGLRWSYQSVQPHLPNDHIARLPLYRVTLVEGQVLRATDPRPDGTVILLEGKRAFVGRWVETRGRIRLFSRSGLALEPGTTLRARVRLRRPRNFYNPGGFDHEGSLARQGIYVVGTLRGQPEILQGGGDPFSGLRKAFGEALSNCPSRARGLLKALVLGQRGEIRKEDQELLQKTGTSHLLAISGLHIGILAGALLLLLRLVTGKRGPRSLPHLLALPLLWAYVILVQAPVSALRAALMAASFSLLLSFGRPRGLFNLLCLAALLILLFWPESLWSPSFQLSFMATAGIILMAPRLLPPLRDDPLWPVKEHLKRKALRYLLGAAVLSLCAQGATLPLILYHFHLFSPVGPLANVVAVPAVALAILPLGLIGLVLSGLWLPLGGAVLRIDSLLVLGLLEILEVLARIPYGHLWLPGPTFEEAVLFYAGLLLFALWGQVSKRKVALGLLLGLWALDLSYWTWKNRPKGTLEIAFLDVGQGDCAFLRLPTGEKMLIDGGGFPGDFDPGRSIIAPFLWSRRILRVDYIILSHPQPDHYRGLLFIADHFRPREFWLPPGEDEPGDLKKLLERLTEKEVRVRRLYRGHELSVGGVSLQVLNPPPIPPEDPNDASLVLRVEGKGRTALFPGDISRRREEEMVKVALPLQAELLKVPHHGSKTSSSYPFVQEVRPLFAVISVGEDNPYGHPHPRVVNRYFSLGAEVLRTDLCGFIHFVGDEKGWTVSTMRVCSAYPSPR